MNNNECAAILARYIEFRKGLSSTNITAELLAKAITYSIDQLQYYWHDAHATKPALLVPMFTLSYRSYFSVSFWDGRCWHSVHDNQKMTADDVRWYMPIPYFPDDEGLWNTNIAQ